jgi:replicative superfamily II helicase
VFVLHKTEAKALAKHLNVALGDADSSSEEDDDDDDGDEKEEDSAGSSGSSNSNSSNSSCSDAASTSSYAGCLHGDMSTLARSTALTSFRNGEFPVLVCTDVAAR